MNALIPIFGAIKPGEIVSELENQFILSTIKLLMKSSFARRNFLNKIISEIKKSAYEDEFRSGSNSPYLAKVEAQFLINLLKQAL
jgi:hypothetical protein